MLRALPAVLALALALGPAVSAASANAERPARRDFDRAPDSLVVHYRVDLGLEAGLDVARELFVYGDGRVVRSEPAVYREAGVWEMALGAGELRALVDALVDHGALTFDAEMARVRREHRLASARAPRSERPPLLRSHDASTRTIHLELLEEAASDEAVAPTNLGSGESAPRTRAPGERRRERHRASMRALRFAKRMNPENQALAGLDRACRTLEALMRDPRFVRTESAGE